MIMRRCKHLGCHNLVNEGQVFCKKHADDMEAYQRHLSKIHAHNQRHQHEYNTTVRKQSDERSKRDAFYNHKEWKQLRLVILERDNYLCKYCERFGIIRPAKIVDHIVPGQVAPQLLRDQSNLATICQSCHRRKTDWEKSFYNTGYTNNKNKIKKDILIKNIEDLPNFSK